MSGKAPLERGSRAVQLVGELVKLRNDYVHPKVEVADADMKPLEENDHHVVVPFSVTATFWPMLQIANQSFLWEANASGRVLRALAGSYRHVLEVRCGASDQDIVPLLLSRFEFAHALMPAVYGDYARDINALAADGIDFGFLNL